MSRFISTYANEETFNSMSVFEYGISSINKRLLWKPSFILSLSPGLARPRSVDKRYDGFLCYSQTLKDDDYRSCFSIWDVSVVWHTIFTPTVVCCGWIGCVLTLTTFSSIWRASSSLIQLVLSLWQGSTNNWSTCTSFEDPLECSWIQLQKPSQSLQRDRSNQTQTQTQPTL